MSTNKGLAIGIGAAVLAGGVLYYLSRDVGAEPPQEGDQRCNGTTLEEYWDGQWVVIERNSPVCGYEPPPPPEEINIHGYIFDSISKQPVAGTDVKINGVQASSQSDGLYWLWHMEYAAPLIITIGAPGYEPYQEVIESPGDSMTINIEMIAIEVPEPPPPPTALSFGGMRFTYVVDNYQTYTDSYVPVAGGSNWIIRWNYPRNIHQVIDFKLRVIHPNGKTGTIKKSLDVYGLSATAITYTQVLLLGTYTFELSAFVDGELIGERTLEYEGRYAHDL